MRRACLVAFFFERSVLLPLLFGCVIGSSAIARADGSTLNPDAHHFAFDGELGYFGQTQDASSLYVLAPRVALAYALSRQWSLAADYGVAGVDSVPEQGSAQTSFRSGNASLLGFYRESWHGARYTLGLGGTVPIAGIDQSHDSRLQHVAFNDAQGMNGLWDVWLWAPSRAAAIGVASITFQLEQQVEIELKTAPALLFPVYNAYGRDPVSVFIPTSVGGSVDRGPLRLGLRLQAVIMPNSGIDALQLSLVPFARIKIDQSFIEARYVANLDEPLAGERGPGIWGFHLGAGATL